jgi:hypothetical protein
VYVYFIYILYNNKNSPKDGLNAPIPFDDDDSNDRSVSHSPLNLGGTSPVEVPKAEPAAKPQVPKPSAPAAKVSAGGAASPERITGIRTFFTKLHAGAINFLDEQITNWLKGNPDIVIKRTNVVTGEIQGKKTEPNIIITVWY